MPIQNQCSLVFSFFNAVIAGLGSSLGFVTILGSIQIFLKKYNTYKEKKAKAVTVTPTQ